MLKFTMQQQLIVLTTVLVALADVISAHGRLREPPSRSTMWRYGFNTTENYNDHELFCGGFTVQWEQNGGKCGICGDNWRDPQPRDNEAGGKYGQGIITRYYKQGQTIQVHVELTARHLGYLEFRICPNNDVRHIATQECLDQYVLERADGAGTKTMVTDMDQRDYYMEYKLPFGLACAQCVFQWKYHAGNSEGCDGDICCVGCGPQEEFYACSDVNIRPRGPHIPMYPMNPFAKRR